MKPVSRTILLVAMTFIASTCAWPAVQSVFVATAATAAKPEAARATAPEPPPSTVHFGIEIWTATDHGSGEAADYHYVIGDGSEIRLLGIYGNAALGNAKPDSNDREFLFSVSSANGMGAAHPVGTIYDPSHHSIDPALYAGILKQTGGNNAVLPINVTFPGGGIVLPRGAVRLSAVTGIYDPNNGFRPISYPTTSPVLSGELQLTFVYSK